MPIRDIEVLTIFLRKVHAVNSIKFQEKHGRRAEVADQLKKHTEELGEYIKALDGKNSEPLSNEYWDVVFSFMATAMNIGSYENGWLSTSDLLKGLDNVCEKLSKRTGIPLI